VPVSAEYRDYLLEALEPLGGVSARRMFGGAGLFKDGLMFALIADDVLYLKADDANRPDFETAGQGPFVYEAKGGKRGVMSYWQTPDELFDEPDDLVDWALRAFDAALRADAAKPPSQRKRR
jgi:DNA transformation protein